mmetsp:Transcript_7138/g.9045  ORF Transcript_7138/g.9045 Transcript_7138/m.9045 type:complete len:335 (-) Transcript_7138:1057-2061(-)
MSVTFSTIRQISSIIDNDDNNNNDDDDDDDVPMISPPPDIRSIIYDDTSSNMNKSPKQGTITTNISEDDTPPISSKSKSTSINHDKNAKKRKHPTPLFFPNDKESLTTTPTSAATPTATAVKFTTTPTATVTPALNLQLPPTSKGKTPDDSIKRPKLLSPFSPKARRIRLQQYNTTSTTTTDTNNNLHWSMIPSRKVSILVNVTPNINSPISSSDEEASLCLYPNINNNDNLQSSDNQSVLSSFSPARSIKSSYSVTTNTSIFHKAPTQPGQEVILVNPKAFGNILPTAITVETARLVSTMKNKSSEDWARKYRFDEVCWPDVKQLIGTKLCRK